MDLRKNVVDGFIEMVFGPRWTYIATVRSFLQNFLSITLADSKWADVISMAASELLENAVKYASEEGTKFSIKYIKAENTLSLHVENFASVESIEVLKEQVKEIADGDAQEVYLKKMQEAALRTDGGSQLGLARIRYEGNADISVDFDNDLVIVNVVFDLK